MALEEADAIVLVVDGRTELTAPDIDLARLLLRTGKPLVLAVNKIDTTGMEPYAEEFRSLGIKELLPISAEHGTGVAELMEYVLSVIPERKTDSTTSDKPHPPLGLKPPAGISKRKGRRTAEPQPENGEESEAEEEALDSARETKVAIIGRPNVGKSTLAERADRNVAGHCLPVAGTTRDAIDELMEHDGHTYRFIDTAGIRRKGKTQLMAEKMSVVMARKHLEAADVALVVIDATEGVTASDATIAGYAHESGRSVIVVINKWDLVPRRSEATASRRPTAACMRSKSGGISSSWLRSGGVCFGDDGKEPGQAFSTLELVARERRKRVGTGEMNRFLSHIDFERASVPHRQAG